MAILKLLASWVIYVQLPGQCEPRVSLSPLFSITITTRLLMGIVAPPRVDVGWLKAITELAPPARRSIKTSAKGLIIVAFLS